MLLLILVPGGCASLRREDGEWPPVPTRVEDEVVEIAVAAVEVPVPWLLALVRFCVWPSG
jgi:hypothetical protein